MTGLGWVWFVVAAGLGAPARYLLDIWVQDRTNAAFPWGTLVVNVTGCLALGVLVGLGHHQGLGETSLFVLGAGGLGAYTTFSTFTFETVSLLEQGALERALINVGAALLLGFVAAAAGFALAALLG